MTKSERPIFITYNIFGVGTKYINVSEVTEAIFDAQRPSFIEIRFKGKDDCITLERHEADKAKEILDLWGIIK